MRLNCEDAGVLRVEDINYAFSDSACHIRLPGKDIMFATLLVSDLKHLGLLTDDHMTLKTGVIAADHSFASLE